MEENNSKNSDNDLQILLFDIAKLLNANNNDNSNEIISKIKVLVKNEAKYKARFSSPNIGVLFFNIETGLEEINSTVTKILGYEFNDIVNNKTEIRKSILSSKGTPYPENSLPLEKTMKTGDSQPEVEIMLPSKDGVYKWISASSDPVYDNNHNFIGALLFLEDITDRKEKESQLIKENQNLIVSERAFIQAEKLTNTGNWLYDLKSKSFLISDGMFRILEIDKESYDGDFEKIARSLIHPDDRKLLEGRLKLAKSGNPLPSTEYRNIFPNGEIKVFKAEGGQLIFDKAGKPDLVLGVLVDITEQKRKEKVILEEQYLQHEKSIETLRLLANETTHTFDNLLAVIYGYIDLAFSENKESVYLEKAMEGIIKACGLSDQIFSFTKKDAVNREIVILDNLLYEKGNSLNNNPSIKFEFEISSDLYPVYCNKIQIALAIENIIRNAIQATQKGGSIKIKAENYFESSNEYPLNDYVRITIRDSGSGMTQDILDHLFEPFFTTKDNGKGLGLAMSYSIIKNHKGKIEVESELTKGSSFYIYLPVANLSIEEPENIFKSEPHIGIGDFIVLEDNKEFHPILAKYLEKFGYTAHIKSTGEEILALLRDGSIKNFDLKGMLLVLYSSCNLGGKELIKEIRYNYPDLPVFVTSTYIDDPIICYPHEYGFTDSIKKPFFRNELELLLNKYIDSA